MKDADKTKAQLISELEELRQRVTNLEKAGVDRLSMDDLTRTQLALALALSAAQSLDESLRQCVEAAISVSGMDCGGVYLVDENTGSIDLAFHTGLSRAFVERASHYEADSPHAQLILTGKPIYSQHQELGLPLDDVRRSEGLRAIAVIAVHHESRVIACLNIASHTLDEVRVSARTMLETIAAQIGSSIARIKAQEALLKAHDDLEQRVEKRNVELVQANEQLRQQISEHKRAEEELRESEERFRKAFDYAALGMVLVSPGGRFLKVNSYFCQMVGYTEEELLNRTFNDVTHPDDYHIGLDVLSQVVDGIVPYAWVEKRYLHKDGRIVWGMLSTSAVRDAVDNVVYLVSHIQDITERKRAEEQVHESEEKYRQLVSTTKDAIMVFYADTRQFIEVNKACEDLYGYSREEFLKLKHTDITLEPEKSEDSIEKALRGVLYRIPVRYHKKKDGTSFPVEISASTFVQKGRRVICGVIRDITERKRAEEERLTYQLQLRSLASQLVLTEQRERRRLATDLHDSIGQLLAISKIKLSALGNVASAGDLAGDLMEIRDLLAQAIQQTRSLIFELSPPVLYELGIEAALESLMERMEKLHDTRFEFVDDRQPKPLGEDLGVLLFRAVQELLVNVVKHARARYARTSIETHDEKIRITVEDDGVGFDISEIDSHIGRAGKFGLFSIRERLNHLGGHFEIASKPGHGTQVSLAVPLQRD